MTAALCLLSWTLASHLSHRCFQWPPVVFDCCVLVAMEVAGGIQSSICALLLAHPNWKQTSLGVVCRCVQVCAGVSVVFPLSLTSHVSFNRSVCLSVLRLAQFVWFKNKRNGSHGTERTVTTQCVFAGIRENLHSSHTTRAACMSLSRSTLSFHSTRLCR